ncbi:unnamed protein product [Brassicogethes aeneus]|uniref:Uncharacterized protein n=1 Tax=Brassicogethes aeneus TaxID=1431903 RepID=A0A9P0BEQ2_BRAAE|nr:unnamed protein product [Brassicogethes aeneus]
MSKIKLSSYLNPIPNGFLKIKKHLKGLPLHLPQLLILILPLGISDISDSNVESNIDFTIDCYAEFFWNNFSIPWDISNNEEHKQLMDGKCSRKIKTKLTHGVVDKMRTFKAMCIKMIRRYPVLRDQDEDNVIIGDGTHSLFNKLQERNNYLNRPHKRNCNDQRLSPIASKKKCLSARAGCSNWSPNVPAEVTDDNEPMPNLDDFEKLMVTSYAQQRMFLNAHLHHL